jgi:hypothetical protein
MLLSVWRVWIILQAVTTAFLLFYHSLLTVNTALCTAHFRFKTIKLGHGAFDVQGKRSVCVRGKY